MGSVGDGSDWYTGILVYWYIQSTQGVIISTLFILWSLFVYKPDYCLGLLITGPFITFFTTVTWIVYKNSDLLVTPMPPWR